MNKLKNAIALSQTDFNIYKHSREELAVALQESKKATRELEQLVGQLRVDNNKWESEFSKQEQMIAKFIDGTSGSRLSNTESSENSRKELEKSLLVRKLKAYAKTLKSSLSQKDYEIEELKKNSKVSKIIEVTIENEEYILENKRLKEKIQEVKHELKNEQLAKEYLEQIVSRLKIKLQQNQQQLSYRNLIEYTNSPDTNAYLPVAPNNNGNNRPSSSTGYNRTPIGANRPIWRAGGKTTGHSPNSTNRSTPLFIEDAKKDADDDFEKLKTTSNGVLNSKSPVKKEISKATDDDAYMQRTFFTEDCDQDDPATNSRPTSAANTARSAASYNKTEKNVPMKPPTKKDLIANSSRTKLVQPAKPISKPANSNDNKSRTSLSPNKVGFGSSSGSIRTTGKPDNAAVTSSSPVTSMNSKVDTAAVNSARSVNSKATDKAPVTSSSPVASMNSKTDTAAVNIARSVNNNVHVTSSSPVASMNSKVDSSRSNDTANGKTIDKAHTTTSDNAKANIDPAVNSARSNTSDKAPSSSRSILSAMKDFVGLSSKSTPSNKNESVNEKVYPVTVSASKGIAEDVELKKINSASASKNTVTHSSIVEEGPSVDYEADDWEKMLSSPGKGSRSFAAGDDDYDDEEFYKTTISQLNKTSNEVSDDQNKKHEVVKNNNDMNIDRESVTSNSVKSTTSNSIKKSEPTLINQLSNDSTSIVSGAGDLDAPGDTMYGNPVSNISVLSSSHEKLSHSKFPVGTAVEGNYQGDGTWYSGKISKERDDGTYDIEYNDGEVENKVKEKNIRSLNTVPVNNSARSAVSVNSKITDKAPVTPVSVNGKADTSAVNNSARSAVSVNSKATDKAPVTSIGSVNGKADTSVVNNSARSAVSVNSKATDKAPVTSPSSVGSVNGKADTSAVNNSARSAVSVNSKATDKAPVTSIGSVNGKADTSVVNNSARSAVSLNSKATDKAPVTPVGSVNGKADSSVVNNSARSAVSLNSKATDNAPVTPVGSVNGKADTSVVNSSARSAVSVNSKATDNAPVTSPSSVGNVNGKADTSAVNNSARSAVSVNSKATDKAPVTPVGSVNGKADSSSVNNSARSAVSVNSKATDKAPVTSPSSVSSVNGKADTSVVNNSARSAVSEKASVAETPSVVNAAMSSEFSKGSRIEGNYAGEGTWYPGLINKIKSDGTYDITYDDGTYEANVKVQNIRSPMDETASVAESATSNVAALAQFSKGSRIDGNYAGEGTWYPGIISKVRADGNYDLTYDDGTYETNVKVQNIRSPMDETASVAESAISNVAALAQFLKGSRIDGNYAGEGTWYPGVISKVRADGNYDLTYDDGTYEANVKVQNIRSPMDETASVAESATSNVAALAQFLKGSRIDGNYAGEGTWYPGVISKVRADGNYDLTYDDGTNETNVKVQNIRSPMDETASVAESATSNVAALAQFSKGSRIDGNYAGEGTWYPGIISKVRADGNYDLTYDDGTYETNVKVQNIRSPMDETASIITQSTGPTESTKGIASSSKFSPGTRIEGNYGQGAGIWYPGTISHAKPDGTYNISYDDGEMETDVLEKYIRIPVSNMYKQGTRIEGNYGQGAGVWYPGTISRTNSDGTYDIAYDDGETEARVKSEYIRTLNEKITNEPVDSTSSTFREGSKIEGNYQGVGSWYPGQISRVRANGTYDIAYDDGETETHVKELYIRTPKALSSIKDKSESYLDDYMDKIDTDKDNDDDNDFLSQIGKVKNTAIVSNKDEYDEDFDT